MRARNASNEPPKLSSVLPVMWMGPDPFCRSYHLAGVPSPLLTGFSMVSTMVWQVVLWAPTRCQDAWFPPGAQAPPSISVELPGYLELLTCPGPPNHGSANSSCPFCPAVQACQGYVWTRDRGVSRRPAESLGTTPLTALISGLAVLSCTGTGQPAGVHLSIMGKHTA